MAKKTTEAKLTKADKAKMEADLLASGKWVYALASSSLTLGGKTYRLGDSVDDWTPEQRQKHRFKIRRIE
jgi:hypothetical protein